MRYRPRLTELMQRTIPDDHRARRVNAGYVREVVRTDHGVSLALTGRGLRRLATAT